jgi:hypothetical protein
MYISIGLFATSSLCLRSLDKRRKPMLLFWRRRDGSGAEMEAIYGGECRHLTLSNLGVR